MPVGEDAGPGEGEAEGLDAEVAHERDVLRIAVVEVVGDVAGIAVGGLAGGVREGVPDGGAAAVFVDGAFDLIGGGGGAPEEAFGRRRGSWRGVAGVVRRGCWTGRVAAVALRPRRRAKERRSKRVVMGVRSVVDAPAPPEAGLAQPPDCSWC